jgi:pimeloyl-ACP methyl ester carboxylesterase
MQMGNLIRFFSGAISGALSVLGIKSYAQFRRDLASSEKRVQRLAKIIETSIGQVVYGSVGQGPPVLVVHGAGGGFDQALFTTQMFGNGYQWIAPSRFGYLGTPLPEVANPEIQADAHAALLDALKIDCVPIIGISAGGPSALQFALRHPERCSALVMVSAISKAMISVASNPEVMNFLAQLSLSSEWMIWLSLQAAIHKVVPPLGVSRRVINSLNKQETTWLKTLLDYVLPIHQRRAGLINDYAQIMQLDIFPLEQIKAHTLVIHAKDDSLVPIQQGHFSADNIPNAQFVELNRGGHLLLGQQMVVRAEVESFLQNVFIAS